ncbi:hypothetical protein ACU4HD_08055 [Cupriavidus basilensis]
MLAYRRIVLQDPKLPLQLLPPHGPAPKPMRCAGHCISSSCRLPRCFSPRRCRPAKALSPPSRTRYCGALAARRPQRRLCRAGAVP